MSEQPLITIVTATFNCADCLPRCLASVAAQTLPDIEHILIDGGSTDGTVELIRAEAVRAGGRVGYWLSEPDRGIYHAWNKALPHIRGEWVLFLGGDDLLYDERALADAAGALRGAPAPVRTVYGKLLSVDEAGREIAVAGRGWEIDRRDFFTQAKQLPHPSMFMRREVFDAGGFDEQYRISSDFDFVARELVAGHDAQFLDRFLVCHTMRGVSVHPRTALRAWRETLRIIAHHRLPVPLAFRIGRVAKAYVFYLMWRLLPEQFAHTIIDKARRIYWRGR